jgi:hypothetical protein
MKDAQMKDGKENGGCPQLRMAERAPARSPTFP